MISNGSYEVTINGGVGNDNIFNSEYEGSSVLFKYAVGDGNDTITNFHASDTIKIVGGELNSSTASGNDVILNIGSGSIKASDFNGKVATIDASTDTQPVAIKGGDSASVLKASSGGATLEGGKGNDKLYGAAGVDTFVYTIGQGTDAINDYEVQDVVGISGAAQSDLTLSDKKNVVTVTFANDKKSKLTITKKNINDAITFDIGGETFEYGKLPSGASFDKNGTTLTIGTDSTLASGSTVSAGEISSAIKAIDASKFTGKLNLVGNAQANSLTASSGGSILYGGNSTKATADKLYGGGGADTFLYAVGDGNDQIYNYSAAGGDIISLVGDASLTASSFKESGKHAVLTIGKDKITINDASGEPIVAINGDNTVTYGAMPEGIGYADNKKTLSVSDPFEGTVKADDFAANVTAIDASGSTKEIVLIGNKNCKALKGGAGTTTLIGSAANDTLSGGTGADVFMYSVGGGKDVIADFDPEHDTIRVAVVSTLTSAAFSEKGNDIIVTVGKGTLTLKDAPRGVISIEQDGAGVVTYTPLPAGLSYDGKKTKLTAAKTFTGVIDEYASTVKEITAASASATVAIVGNDLNNVLRAGSGGSTLDGGSGDDTLNGGKGADVFKYAAGNDLIVGYSSAQGDKIELGANVTGSSIKGSDVMLKFGNDTLTIKGGLNSAIDIVGANGDENLYMFTGSKVYGLKEVNADLTDGSGSSAQQPSEYWFTALNDGSVDELDSIMAVEDMSLDLSKIFGSEPIKDSMAELVTGFARRSTKK